MVTGGEPAMIAAAERGKGSFFNHPSCELDPDRETAGAVF
jgi:hypothetical protein